MNNLDELLNKINEKTKESPIFYFSNDIERSLGFEDKLANFHQICIDDNQVIDLIRKVNPNLVCLVQETEEDIFRSSVKLISHSKISEYLAKFSEKYIQTFKISPAFEKKVLELNAKALNTTAKLNRMFENKLTQYQLLKDKINFPKTIVTELKNADFEGLKRDLGENFVIQFNLGHTGASTHIIISQEIFEEIKSKFPERFAKFSEFIDGGLWYTINACIYNNRTFVGGLNYQLTGIPELTTDSGATVGNDYAQRKGISEEVLNKIIEQTQSIGGVMSENGFRGMFGVDLIIRDDNVYIIEVNARQTASVPFFTKLQIHNNEIPLSMLHLAEFMDIKIEINENEYNLINTKPIKASQIINRAKELTTLGGEITPGLYRLQSDNAAREELSKGNANIIFTDEEEDKPLIFQRSSYNVADLFNNAGILITSRAKGMALKKGDEICRIQMLQEATDSELNIYPWIKESLISIEQLLK